MRAEPIGSPDAYSPTSTDVSVKYVRPVAGTSFVSVTAKAAVAEILAAEWPTRNS